MHVVRPRTGQLGLPTSREVVLEHIVERKRMDDLAGSIMDGRFAEQKVWTTLTHSQILCEFFFVSYSFVYTAVVYDIVYILWRSMETPVTSRCPSDH